MKTTGEITWVVARDMGDVVEVLSRHVDEIEAKIYYCMSPGAILGIQIGDEFEIICGATRAGGYSYIAAEQ